MHRFSFRKFLFASLTLLLIASTLLIPTPQINAADHGDAPLPDEDRSCDINDVYAFLDPNDNTKLVIAVTIQGFIVPGEAVNFGAFDQNVRYRFALETSGDVKADQFFDLRFTERRTSGSEPQTATITLPGNRTFQALTTPASLSPTAPEPRVTTDPATGISFFGGVVDDPFTFDIPGFNRFVASVTSGNPNPDALKRGRDSFAGYNTLGIALSIPLSFLKATGKDIGVTFFSQRQTKMTFKNGGYVGKGDFVTIDRMGNPAVNVALIPFPKKNSYNFGTPEDDARATFAPDIINSLKALGTTEENINILASVVLQRGDYLRVDPAKPNRGTGGGNNPEAAYPNGRRLVDDTVDTILFFIANQNVLSDNANVNDVPFRDAFPFFGASQQPREPGVVDDNTRN
ncbi:MAG: DUF4331 family protein [Acidobacteria bacterium]|nr:DUF4331 family protein [Acidobacteriota bacterium]